MQTELEGILRAAHYDAGGQGKQFLGAAIECSDGRVWVIDYEEQSPFHVFAGRQVVALGEPYQPHPQCQHLTGWDGGKQLGHFRVATIRPTKVTPDLGLVEVSAGHRLRGRLERRASDTGESMLSFVTEKGDVCQAANNPAGARIGQNLDVWAYSVRLPIEAENSQPYLWIICPYSDADLWEWRGRL